MLDKFFPKYIVTDANHYFFIMMNLVYTLLTLAAGMLVGSAEVFLLQEKKQSLRTWVSFVLIFVTSLALALWCEHKIRPLYMLPVLSILLMGVLWLYGFFWGIAFLLRKELKKELKVPANRDWISAACVAVLLLVPLCLWPVLEILTSWNSFTTLGSAVAIGLMCMCLLWILFHLIWWAKYGARKKTS